MLMRFFLLTLVACFATTLSFNSAAAQTVYLGDAASEGQNVLAGDDGYSLQVLTIVNLSDGNSAGPVIYTAPMDQTLQLTEVNFFTGNIGATGGGGATADPTGDTGNLTPFIVRILGAASDGSFDGQQASSFEILAVGDVISTDQPNSLINGAFTVGGTNPTISLSAGDRIAAGFLSDENRLVHHDSDETQGVGEYINNGDSLTDATDGTLTSDSNFDFDRAMSFNIGFIVGGSAATGDFTGNGIVDCDDLDGFINNIGNPATGMLANLDIDSDGTITDEDADETIRTLVVTSNGITGTLPGDLNCDGAVNVLGDAFALVGSLGQTVTSYSDGDVNFDGIVNVLGDAFILVGNLGETNTAP